MTGEQRESVRQLIRKRLESAGTAQFLEYAGREALRQLAADVKARGRKRLWEMRRRPEALTAR